MSAPCLSAFGHGAPLQGHKLVRLAYTDEAGLANPAEDPLLLVCSVIVHGDQQARPMIEDLDYIVNRYIPAADRPGFIFHATDLFSGGPYFTRDKWPREKRWQILSEIAGIVGARKLPVCLAYTVRQDYAKIHAAQGRDPSRLDSDLHALVFAVCALTIDKWMIENTDDEIVVLVAEDANKAKNAIKNGVQFLSSPEKVRALAHRIELDPITRIMDTPHFVRKDESRLMQIVDACAFLQKRRILRKKEADFFGPCFEGAQIVTLSWDVSGLPFSVEQSS